MKHASRAAGRRRWLVAALVLVGVAKGALAQDVQVLERGKALFTTVQPACAVCHTLKAAGATGEVGPVLDELRPDAQRVLRVLHNGFGVMPSYEGQLPEADLRALASFVAHSTGGAPLPTGQ